MSTLVSLKASVRQVKHLAGWRSPEQLVAFAVDDYGSVRTADAAARDVLRRTVPDFGGQMDEFDAVETRQDLEALFETLARHRDREGNPCILTAYCLSANPDFERIRRERAYSYETLAQTYARLESKESCAYSGMEELWKEGMHGGVIKPQCHGREHYCIPLIDYKLKHRSPDLEANLSAESMAGLSSVAELNDIGFTQAFGLTEQRRVPEQAAVIEDGLRLFEAHFGFPSRTFVPPAGKFNRAHDRLLRERGVEGVDVPFLEHSRSGLGRRLPRVNFLGQGGAKGPIRVVRTLSFEPCSGGKSDAVGTALSEIESAFAWKKPVIISSHRVNFGGHIDPSNRERGLQQLDELIGRILKRWPAVRFLSVDQLVEMIRPKVEH
jgi:hypothetical protein